MRYEHCYWCQTRHLYNGRKTNIYEYTGMYEVALYEYLLSGRSCNNEPVFERMPSIKFYCNDCFREQFVHQISTYAPSIGTNGSSVLVSIARVSKFPSKWHFARGRKNEERENAELQKSNKRTSRKRSAV